ncbi:MAG: hypothetical protein ABI690_18840 [Chloroflexota bacterium]
MPSVWSSPKTWSVGELVTAALLNSHLRDNFDFIKTPPTALYILNESSDYTTTSTSFVNVDGAKLALTITTAGGDVLVGFCGSILQSAATVFFDVEVDGSRTAGDDGLCVITPSTASARMNATCFKLIQGLSSGLHTFKLQWKVNSGTATLFAGAGTANGDIHPQFFVREVS